MIEEIYIRDLGVIQEARLPFGKGLTVITGETGAGKTMVLSALGLLLGERADSAAIRRGQDQAFVEGRWLVGGESPVNERVRDAGSEVEQGELILNRSISSEGRSRASVSGRSVPVGLLNELGEMLVVVHGQSDQIRLKSAVAQREALDQFGGPVLAEALASYQVTYKAWRELTQKLENLKASLDARAAEADELRQAVTELEKLDAREGEDVELAEVGHGLVHQRLDRIRAGRVERHGDGGIAQRFGRAAGRFLENVGHGNPRPFGHEPPRNRRTDTAAAAGNDRYLACQSAHFIMFPIVKVSRPHQRAPVGYCSMPGRMR